VMAGVFKGISKILTGDGREGNEKLAA
jgi:hypothetical protein